MDDSISRAGLLRLLNDMQYAACPTCDMDGKQQYGAQREWEAYEAMIKAVEEFPSSDTPNADAWKTVADEKPPFYEPVIAMTKDGMYMVVELSEDYGGAWDVFMADGEYQIQYPLCSFTKWMPIPKGGAE